MSLPYGQKPRKFVKLKLADIPHILRLFDYDPDTGIVLKNEAVWGHQSKQAWFSLNRQRSVPFDLADGTHCDMPITQLGYILAYKQAPRRKVVVINIPESPDEPLSLRKDNLKLA